MEDVLSFIKYILETILAAYKGFSIVETKQTTIEMVRIASKTKLADLLNRASPIIGNALSSKS